MTSHKCARLTPSADAELAVLWQRLVVGGATCERCGDTGAAVRRAVATLAQELAPQGVVVRLEEKALPPFAVAESNRVFFNGAPLEELLGATAGMSHCQSCGELMGGRSQGQPQGHTDCRTLIVDGREHEALSEELILRAGRIAAQRLSAKQKESV
ncbi:DUF2703 domain-containing protein [Humidesulfovibrio sp.]